MNMMQNMKRRINMKNELIREMHKISNRLTDRDKTISIEFDIDEYNTKITASKDVVVSIEFDGEHFNTIEDMIEFSQTEFTNRYIDAFEVAQMCQI